MSLTFLQLKHCQSFMYLSMKLNHQIDKKDITHEKKYSYLMHKKYIEIEENFNL